MKKFTLILLLFFNINCFSQEIKNLILSDSILIKSNLANCRIVDINIIRGDFWVRFDSWQKEEKDLQIEFTNQKGNSYNFISPDLSISSEIGPVFPISNGFLQPKYSGKNKLVFFDTIENSIKFLKIKTKESSYLLYPNTNAYTRNSFGYKKPYFIINRSSIPLKGKTDKSFSFSLMNVFKKESPFVLYNMEDEKATFFGGYPDIYRNKRLLIGNRGYYFTLDSNSNKLYVSFQANDQVIQYDIKTFEKTNLPTTRGKFIEEKKLWQESSKLSDYINKDFLSLLADSYGEIFLNENGFFREYSKGINPEDLIDISPATDASSCPLPSTIRTWYQKMLEKKKYLQRFNKIGNLLYEINVPKQVNTYLGYNYSKEEFYFWKNNIYNSNCEAVIYIYKLAN